MAKMRTEAVRVECSACNGTGKRASEWDMLTGAVVAFGPCGSCMTRGQVLVNAPVALELVAA
jgi:DnaJ-class molecular chaperone